MNELADSYTDLLEECLVIKADIDKRYEELIFLYWTLGKTITRYENKGLIDVQYNKQTIKKLSDDLKIHITTIYRIRQFALLYPTDDKYAELKQKTKDLGRNFSWTDIRNNVLPAPKDQPEAYGGKPAVVDSLMSEVETLSRKAEELSILLHDDSLPLDKREQMVGVVQQALDVMSASSREVEYVLPAVKRDGYLDYIRGLPCVICYAGPPSDPHHLETGGVGMKGCDYVTLPMCRRHHDLYHLQGEATFGEEFGVDLFREVTRNLVAWLEHLTE